MTPFFTALDAVLPLFLIILAGVIFSKAHMASDQWVEILNRFALWIGFPSLVITLLAKVDLQGGGYGAVMGVNSLYIVICILLAFPWSRLWGFSRLRRRTLYLLIGYGNVTYLGIPVLQTVLGDESLPVGGLLSAVYVFWLLTLGLLLTEVDGDQGFHPGRLAIKLITNPLLLSVIIGMLLSVSRLQLPAVVAKSLSMLSQSVTPLVLFSLGIFMAMQKIGDVREWGHIALFSLLIMVILPGIFYLVVSTTGLLDGLHLKASMLEAAMPVGLTPYALSQQYRLDTSFTARVVLLSTSLSLLLLPLWIVILG